MSEIAELLALEAERYLAAVEVFRQECPGEMTTGKHGCPVRSPAGPKWRSEADEIGWLPIASELCKPARA